MGTCYILIAVSLLNGVSSSYGSQDQVITTLFGKTATLPCQIANQGSDLQSLYWGKDGKRIYSRTSDGENDNGKYSVTDTESLVIPDVTESDAGNYSCIVVRKSLATVKGDIMQLYVIDISVSHCKGTSQEVDGCSCNINGSNITSLECSASGFPHPPVITWEEEDRITYRSPSVDLTSFSENTTLTCKAKDVNLKGVVEYKTVCVYYAREVTLTDRSPVETNATSVNVRVCVAAIVILSLILILVLLKWLKGFLAAAYKRKKGKAFHFPTSITCTSMPKTLEEQDEPPLHGKDIGANDAGRVEPVLNNTSNWINNATLQRSAETGDLGDPDAASINLHERDRDECEVLITEPDFQRNRIIQPSLPMPAMPSSLVPFNPWPYFLRGEQQSSEIAMMSNIRDGLVTGHFGLSGNSYFDAMLPSFPMQLNMTSPMASSMVACNPLSPALLWERQSSENAAMCSATSPIYLGFDLERGYSGLRGYICLNCSTVTWTSSVSEPVVQFGQEEDEIPDTPSTAKLLED